MNNIIDKTPTCCVGKCKLNPIEHYCMGCWRTLDQIINWAEYTQSEKQRILNSKTTYNIKQDSFPKFSRLRTINDSIC
jgi:predicted Fe-S protein YdhL (DUF1289 family)